jgi:hypothetical protein
MRDLATDWRMPSSGMWSRVDLVWTDVSEELIASIFRVEEPLARNQREQVAADWVKSKNTQLYKNRKGGRVGHMGNQHSGEGKVMWRWASKSRNWIMSGGTRQGYQAGNDPIASGLSCRPCIDLRSLVDLSSYSRGFLREQMRCFHDLLRHPYWWDGAQSQWPP